MRRAVRTTARTAAFIPCASPPDVRTPIFTGAAVVVVAGAAVIGVPLSWSVWSGALIVPRRWGLRHADGGTFRTGAGSRPGAPWMLRSSRTGSAGPSEPRPLSRWRAGGPESPPLRAAHGAHSVGVEVSSDHVEDL